ncbi:MAG TPA: cysteine desulfurase [Gammaproteobacteria bacterium]|jgi:cysteine desulfurase/selenocysteine lyase|nr:cysteine desulfurase [Gammaproteobacteria bacterium]
MKNHKADFPIFLQKIHGKSLTYLDSSATAQQPAVVIEAVKNYYQESHSNVHRGVHELSGRATFLYENTRKKIQSMLNAKHAHEIIFTNGTTSAINLIANTFGKNLAPDDEVIISEMEHHSNIVPWQLLPVTLKVIPISDDGEINLDDYKKLFSSKTKLVSIAHASNVLGTINPIKEMIAIAHEKNIPVLIDGAQAFPHLPVDVRELDCDFYTFSAHKAYGPTGVGVLYGKSALLEKLPPYQGGGAMIESVSFTKTTYAGLPYKFEAGTPNTANIVGFHAALTYLENMGMQYIVQHEKDLLTYATEKLKNISGLTIMGNAREKLGVISFTLENIHPHDIATILDREGIAVRAGHHCAMPIMTRFQIPACVRASFGLYNSIDDVDALVSGIETVKRIFHV